MPLVDNEMESPPQESIQLNVREAILLQLAGAATGKKGVLACKQILSNIKHFSNLDLDYPSLLSTLESMRDDLQVGEGEIGVDVNYVSLKPR